MARAAIAVTALAVVWALLRPRKVAVTGASMEPTLHAGDRLLAVRPWRVEPADLVVVADPRDAGRWIVKRVARRRDGRVELAGDNPAASTDSRTFGAVPVRALLGRVVYRYAPADRAGRVSGGTPAPAGAARPRPGRR